MSSAQPAFAEGIERYVELFRAAAPSSDIAAVRLAGDLTAARFAEGFDAGVRRTDSYVVLPGREMAVRFYEPEQAGEGARPAICYFHGGGFSMGSIESFDLAATVLAQATGAVVASFQYRRLPEADYAAAQSDCDEAFAWLARMAPVAGIDPARIVLGGDSAGALLAFACAANARDSGGPAPAGLVLFYGTLAMDPDRPAYDRALDPLLTGDRVRGYMKLFRDSGGLADNPAPIDRTDLAGLPPTHLVAAEFDPLCEESGDMAQRLQDAGVSATCHVAPGMIHGFLRAVAVSPAARHEVARAAEAMRPWLG